MDREAKSLIDKALEIMDEMSTHAIEQIEIFENKPNKTQEEERHLASLYTVQRQIGQDEDHVFHDYMQLKYHVFRWTAEDYRKFAEIFATIAKYF